MRDSHNKFVLFVVGSTYSLLNAIHLARRNILDSIDKDIIIIERDDQMGRVAQNLHSFGIFKNIYLLKYINSANITIKTLTILFPHFMVSNNWLSYSKTKFFIKNKYSVIIAQSYFYAILFRLYNLKAKVYLIDEGVSSYTGRVYGLSHRSTVARLAIKLFNKIGINFIDGIYLYSPDNYVGEQLAVKKINKIKNEDLDLYSKIFNYKYTISANSSNIYYLGSPFWGLRTMFTEPNVYDPDFEQFCFDIVNELLVFIDPRSIIYRPHPIEKKLENLHSKNLIIDNGVNLWELFVGNELTDNDVIISFLSTGATTPFFVYGKQPFLIFLHKILKHEFLGANDFINNLNKSYKDPGKVLIPNTLLELKKILISLNDANST